VNVNISISIYEEFSYQENVSIINLDYKYGFRFYFLHPTFLLRGGEHARIKVWHYVWDGNKSKLHV
jgi:hypothetical protein